MQADARNQLDEQLKDLAIVAQQQAQGAKERRIAFEGGATGARKVKVCVASIEVIGNSLGCWS